MFKTVSRWTRWVDIAMARLSLPLARISQLQAGAFTEKLRLMSVLRVIRTRGYDGPYVNNRPTIGLDPSSTLAVFR